VTRCASGLIGAGSDVASFRRTELGIPTEGGSEFLLGAGNLYPAYVRGLAYLAPHQGPDAAPEFQTILHHRGIVVTDPIGALAHVQLGRAYALSGDKTKAKSAYQDFLTLWKDADPDIPILKQGSKPKSSTRISDKTSPRSQEPSRLSGSKLLGNQSFRGSFALPEPPGSQEESNEQRRPAGTAISSKRL
jgi:hypothetical protein